VPREATVTRLRSECGPISVPAKPNQCTIMSIPFSRIDFLVSTPIPGFMIGF
jgi:hypothetical protein